MSDVIQYNILLLVSLQKLNETAQMHTIHMFIIYGRIACKER